MLENKYSEYSVLNILPVATGNNLFQKGAYKFKQNISAGQSESKRWWNWASILISTQLQILLVSIGKKANSLECSRFRPVLTLLSKPMNYFGLKHSHRFHMLPYSRRRLRRAGRSIPRSPRSQGCLSHLCLGFRNSRSALPSAKAQRPGTVSHPLSTVNPVSFSSNGSQQLLQRNYL